MTNKTIVQNVNSIGYSTNLSATMAAPTSGNLLVAFVHYNYGVIVTIGSGWTFAKPYALQTWTYDWNSGPFGLGFIAYKYAGVSESTTQTPGTLGGVSPYGCSIFEISGAASWDLENTFQPDRASSGVKPQSTHLPSVIIHQPGSTYETASNLKNFNSTTSALVLAQIVMYDLPAITFSGSTATGPWTQSTSATTSSLTGAWRQGLSSKSGSTNSAYAFYNPLEAADLTFGTLPLNNGSWMFMSLAGLSASGGSISDIPITTTVTVPSVQQPTFKYTLIT